MGKIGSVILIAAATLIPRAGDGQEAKPKASPKYEYVQARGNLQGAEVYIRVDPKSRTVAGMSKSAYRSFEKAMKARDTEGIEQLISNGELVVFTEDTRVRSLVSGLGVSTTVPFEVRVLEGKRQGQVVYINLSKLYFRRDRKR